MSSLEFEKEKKEFRNYYDCELRLFEEATSSFSTLVALLLADHDKFDIPRVISRVKDREECIKKFERKYLKGLEQDETPYEIKEYLSDIIGLRVITLYETDIELAKEVLAENFNVLDVTDKSHSLEEKDDVFGYKGLHLDLKLSKARTGLPEYSRITNLQFEVQIRSIVQDSWSVLDHKIKYKRNIPHPLKRRINRMAALFELADQEFVNIRNETIELENKAREAKKQKIPKKETAQIAKSPVDAFYFLKIMHGVFPGYEFYGYKVDGFIDELKTINPDLTVSILEESLKENAALLEEYRDYQYSELLNKMNPYTCIRHALYLKGKTKHKALLFDLQRQTFDKWLEEKSS